ncbi:Transmembrane protein 65 [Frankliniella fusca]|uniref:Transmembrane protein 65 n=1 Tax=Frankliniella fusca TaxID=407009 RepID=A0AAE1HMK8_9NEOP|nr:Transmembrane protein 65 [Frankliniella fusca]
MYSATVPPLTAAIASVTTRPYLLQVLVYPHITSRLGCQLPRVSFSSSNHLKKEATETLDREKADALVLRFTEEERTTLLTALQSYQAKQAKAEYEGQLAAIRWRSKFGRPSKVPNVGDVDPTGSFCPVPEDWLIRKYAETVPKPSTSQLASVGLHNALPFVGFGFLDNAIMIIAGDYIELMLGSVIAISTMAAAALGNTFSDIMGIGSAWYVESLAAKVGIKPPALSPIQLDMKSSRWAANMGRCLGVTVGCLLGMLPLLFIDTGKDKDKKDKKNE